MDDVLAGFLSEKALATQLGHHLRTIQRWRKERRGPRFTMNGRHFLYHREDIDAWLRQGGVAAVRAAKRKRREARR